MLKRTKSTQRNRIRIKRQRKIKERTAEHFLDWGLKKADQQFSMWIRHRDKKCIRCGATKETDRLQNSHFWGRIRKNVRYDPENCDTLCATCHYWGDSQRGIIAWEEEKQGAYRRFKIEQLGQERYDAMEARAQILTKNDVVIKKCQQFLATQEYEGKPKYLTLQAIQKLSNSQIGENGEKMEKNATNMA